MSFSIEKKFVVGISSSALFNLEKEDQIFENLGLKAYKDYQIKNRNKIIEIGTAFQFIKRFLNINNIYTDEKPVEVVLLSKNSPETGLRIFNSIKHYGLDISRGAFTSGDSPYEYIPSFNISLFLSTNEDDVMKSIRAGYPGGRIVKAQVVDEADEGFELRVAFDFDGVIIDDESERVFHSTNQVELFHEHEVKNIDKPHNPGLLADFFKKLAYFQKIENKKLNNDNNYKKFLTTAIVTARNAPSHERAIKTLEEWYVSVDQMFLMGGIEKKRILSTFKPHLFIDDQLGHLDKNLENITLVHLPFGIRNEEIRKNSSESKIGSVVIKTTVHSNGN